MSSLKNQIKEVIKEESEKSNTMRSDKNQVEINDSKDGEQQKKNVNESSTLKLRELIALK